MITSKNRFMSVLSITSLSKLLRDLLGVGNKSGRFPLRSFLDGGQAIHALVRNCQMNSFVHRQLVQIYFSCQAFDVRGFSSRNLPPYDITNRATLVANRNSSLAQRSRWRYVFIPSSVLLAWLRFRSMVNSVQGGEIAVKPGWT